MNMVLWRQWRYQCHKCCTCCCCYNIYSIFRMIPAELHGGCEGGRRWMVILCRREARLMPLKWHNCSGWLGCCHRVNFANAVSAGERETFAEMSNCIFATILKNDDPVQTKNKQTINNTGCEVKDRCDFEVRGTNLAPLQNALFDLGKGHPITYLMTTIQSILEQKFLLVNAIRFEFSNFVRDRSQRKNNIYFE